MSQQSSNRGNWFRRTWPWVCIAVFAVAVLSRMTIHFGYIDQDKKEAAARIEEFHRRMNVGEFDQLYDDADPAFKRALKREEWLKHMQDAREQYGTFKNAESSKS